MARQSAHIDLVGVFCAAAPISQGNSYIQMVASASYAVAGLIGEGSQSIDAVVPQTVSCARRGFVSREFMTNLEFLGLRGAA